MNNTLPTCERQQTIAFRNLRDRLLEEGSSQEMDWPAFETFNWVQDWFDVISRNNDRNALWVVTKEGDQSVSFRALSHRAAQLSGWMKKHGIEKGDRLLVLLPNCIALYEILLAAIKLGVVVIPSHMNINEDDYRDRIVRGRIKHVFAHHSIAANLENFPDLICKVAVDGQVAGWTDFADSQLADQSRDVCAITSPNDPLFGYFTSGTTSKPKLVLHSHVSYPVGHLSSMHWNGVRPGDVHLNVSAPGWAKHSWSSFFVPWNAESTIVALEEYDCDAQTLIDTIHRLNVTTFCAPPTVWRKMILQGLGEKPEHLRELVGAGEPLTPEVVDAVHKAWGLVIRDGYGQTEATGMIGTPPYALTKPNSIGQAMPGYRIALIDPQTGIEGDIGEICVDLATKPVGLMLGYDGDKAKTAEAFRGGFYHSGDIASRDSDGYFTVLGRLDDVFKSFDYRISPYELEGILIKHPKIDCVAVVPSPHPIGLCVPKAYVCLRDKTAAHVETVNEIDRWQQQHIKPEHHIRRLAFIDALPRTVTGKIRRADLRQRETQRESDAVLRAEEFDLAVQTRP